MESFHFVKISDQREVSCTFSISLPPALLLPWDSDLKLSSDHGMWVPTGWRALLPGPLPCPLLQFSVCLL